MCEKYWKSRQATDGSIVRRMVYASRMTKAAKTHLYYLIFIGFLRKHLLQKRAYTLRYMHTEYVAPS